MIRHIFKIIWNEKKINILLVVEYILIFCILWFVGEYMYTFTVQRMEPNPRNIDHTYRIFMERFDPIEGSPTKYTKDDYHTFASTVDQRLRRYPGIESVGFSHHVAPYMIDQNTFPYLDLSDSLNHFLMVDNPRVNEGFFEVFKIPVHGNIGDWTGTPTDSRVVIVSPDAEGLLGRKPVADIRAVQRQSNQRVYNVVGYTPRLKMTESKGYQAFLMQPMPFRDVTLNNCEISIRVRPSADRNFVEKFMREMSDQLQIGEYYLANVVSYKDIRKNFNKMHGITETINARLAVIIFLLLNIFLGILGSFWFRTQSRRSEIGLRIAMGSSKGKVRRWMIGEAMLLLAIASVVATVGCYYLQQTELPQLIGAETRIRMIYGYVENPDGNGYTITKKAMGLVKQDYINFAISFLLLALITFIAVWYPAKKASDTQPAETLHED